jgi:hypothetical protein
VLIFAGFFQLQIMRTPILFSRWRPSVQPLLLVLVTTLLTLLGPVARAQITSWQAALASAVTGQGSIVSRNIATDGSGNVYVVGYFTGKVRLGATMLTASAGSGSTSGRDAFVAKWNSTTNGWVWALAGGSSDDDQATNVAVTNNAVYVSGYFGGVTSATFGNLTFPLGLGLNLFVLKLADAGSTATARWVQTGLTSSNYSAAMAPAATALAVSGSSVYVAGQFSGPTLKIGSTTLANAGGSNSTNDAFVAKLTDTGLSSSWQWARRAGGAANDQATSLAVSGSQVYLGGYFTGMADFGATTLTSVGAAGTTDIFLARLNDLSFFEWALRAGGTGDDRANAVVADGSTIYVAGNAKSRSPDFTPLALTTPATGGVDDLFVAKLSDAGPSPAFVWVERAGGAPTAAITGLALSGNAVYVTGDFIFASALHFGTAILANLGTLNDVFVARLDDAGSTASYAWAHQLGSSGADAAAGIAADASRVYVGGAVNGNATTFDAAPTLRLLTGQGNNCVLGQLSTAGTWQQSQMGFIGGGWGPSVFTVDNCGFVYVAGSLSGQAQLGNALLGSEGSVDLIVAKWNPVSNTWIWAAQAGGVGGELPTGIAVNNNGQVYVTGTLSNGSATFTPSTATFGSTVLTHAGGIGDDAFVAKLTDAGTSASFDWACPVASTSNEALTAVVAGGNNVYVAGYFKGPGLRIGSTYLVPNGSGADDLLVGKLTDLGSTYRIDWAMRAGGYNEDQATCLALAGNHLYVAGSYTTSLPGSGLPDAFVARITDAGTPSAFDWLAVAPGNTRDVAQSVAVRGTNVYVAGYFFSTSIAFGNVQLYNSTVNNNQFTDGFVAGLVDNGTSGSFAWAQRVSGPQFSSELCNSVVVTGQHVYVGGTFNGASSRFGTASLSSQGDSDGFVARLTEVGATTSFDWAQGVGSSNFDQVTGLHVRGTTVHVLGTIGGTGPAAVGTTTLTGPGSFLARLTDSDISVSPTSFTYGSPFFCRTASNPLPTITGTAGGTFAATPAGLVIDAATGLINLTASATGTYTISYTAGGMCGSTATQALTVSNGLSAAFAYSATVVCAGSAAPVAPVLGAGATAGMFSSTSGLALNATTGLVSPATSQPGTYTITNTVAASAGCAAATSTATLTIAAPAVVTFAYPNSGSYCQNGASVLPALSGTVGGSFAVLPASGLPVDPVTGALTLRGSTPGTYTITYAVNATCPASASQTIIVNALPATPTLTVTGNPATGLLLTASGGVSYQYYLNGVPVPGATNATLLLNSGMQNGSYTVVITNAIGCVSAPSTPVSVVITATASSARQPLLLVYPNPTPADLVTVTLPATATELYVLDALGRAVRHVALSARTTTVALDLTGLSAGVYVIRCGVAATRLVVK